MTSPTFSQARAIPSLLLHPMDPSSRTGAFCNPPTAPTTPCTDSVKQPASRAEDSLCTLESSLPTPPKSSSSSILNGNDELSATNELNSESQKSLQHSSFARVQSGNLIVPLRTRRYTNLHTSTPQNVNPPVYASHISNPTNRRPSTAPSSPLDGCFSFSALSALTSNLESIKLTHGVTSPPSKSTPPFTPRALSSNGSEHQSASSPSQNGLHNTSSDGGDGTSSRPAPPIAPPKGKLFVNVVSARGLKPSTFPYAVCSFEWIESIAHGPRQDVTGNDQTAKFKDQEGPLPLKRSGPDMSRSIAIPMKSRQSSTTSLTEQRNFRNSKQVTDIKWDHEAVLYVKD